MSGVVGPSCQRQVRFGICRLETMVILDNDGEGLEIVALIREAAQHAFVPCLSPRFSRSPDLSRIRLCNASVLCFGLIICFNC